jgi:hypothetical protein
LTDRGNQEPDRSPDDDTWDEEDERRYQERRSRDRKAKWRARRQAAVFVVIVLLVLGAGTTAAGVYQGWWDWPPWAEPAEPVPIATPCPTPHVTAAPVGDVTVTVLNSTQRSGLAKAVAAELTARGFVVPAVGNDPAPQPVPGAAVVRFGPEGLLAARTVAAHVDGAELADDGRAGAAVELSLGEAYTTLRPPDVAAALVAPAPVTAPPGCAAPSRPAPAG